MRPRVLIVDDNPETLESLREAVEAMGYAAQTAMHAGDARILFEMNRPEAVLLGLPLPGVDSVAVFTALRRIDAGVPIVVVTGEPELGRKLLRQGAFDYVQKPVDSDHVAGILAVATRGEWPQGSERTNAQEIPTTALAKTAFRVAAIARHVTAPDTDRQRLEVEAHAALREALVGHPRTALEHLVAVRRLLVEDEIEISLADFEAVMAALDQLRAYLPQFDDSAADPAA